MRNLEENISCTHVIRLLYFYFESVNLDADPFPSWTVNICIPVLSRSSQYWNTNMVFVQYLGTSIWESKYTLPIKKKK